MNPVPHAGTISVFLLGVVIVSGLYITLFFSFGYAASYDSVASMEEHAIQRIVRAVHRYASAAMVLTTLVHAVRVFGAQRFTTHRRRWRWASGVASLTLVWLGGVSGYWLVWDRRAAAISEVSAQLLKPFGVADGFVVNNLLGHSPGSGSGFLLGLWFVHLGVTALIGWFTFRHLRRSKQPWLPPRHWMAIMGGAIVVVSVALPLGMLGPARPDQLVRDMPLDAFVLFLLPPLLSDSRWIAVAVMALLLVALVVLPRLLRGDDPSPVNIDEDACTGCRICVQDCPYDALSMSDVGRLEPKAVLDTKMCVSCGICVGSCAFDAIELPGWQSPAGDVSDRAVMVICDRHGHPDGSDDAVVVPVSCAGMFVPNAARGYIERGAASVNLVGCAPSDCRYGIGNTLAAERLAGDRAPHPPRRYEEQLRATWMTTDDLGRSPEHDENRSTDSQDRDTTLMNGRLAAPAAVVLLSIFAVVAATRAPFRTDSERAGLRVIVDHDAGARLVETGSVMGAIRTISVTVDGMAPVRKDVIGTDGRAVGFDDFSISAGRHEIQVSLIGSDEAESVTFADSVELDTGERLVVTATDVPPTPGASDGRAVFDSRAAGCAVCHSTREGRDGVGPSLYGLADVAGSRVEGLSAENYIRQSILLPDQNIVEGWPSGQMLPIYRDRLTEHELESLLAYLETLTAEGAS